MKKIGIVAGKSAARALEIKVAVLAKDSKVEVVLDEETFRSDAPTERIALGDLKIDSLNAVDRLTQAGCEAIAFADVAVGEFVKELQKETATILVEPVADVAAYAANILSEQKARPLPFKVGMIGGLGPAASVDLYDKITKATPAKIDQEHLRVVIEQNPQIPDRTAHLLRGGEDSTLALYGCAKKLQADGCDALIIPCNTAHAFIPYMERHLNIPFINMQQATMDEIKAKFGDKARIGLMATTGTVQTGIYSKKAEAMGLPIFAPDEERQNFVMDAIYGPVGAKAGITTGKCKDELLEAAAYLVKNFDCNVLILGCTELPLILDEGMATVAGKEVFIIDPTSALARKVVATAMAANKERGY